jgi:hypothetical protein
VLLRSQAVRKAVRGCHVGSPTASRSPERYSSRYSKFRYRVPVSNTSRLSPRMCSTISRASSSRPKCAWQAARKAVRQYVIRAPFR